MYDFKLSEKFVNKYSKIDPPFGFGVLSEIVFRRSYSRTICSDCMNVTFAEDDKCKQCESKKQRNEEWFETIKRVVNGCYSVQKRWINRYGLGWDEAKAQRSAKIMYDKMFNLKFLPGGRGLWAMGSGIIEERNLFAALFNCMVISTQNIKDDPSFPFAMMTDASMCGIGVSFDTRGADLISIKGVNKNRKKESYTIPDTREGWVESVKILLESYFLGLGEIEFDYSQIRGPGILLRTFGGRSSGPEPLKDLHLFIKDSLNENTGNKLSSRLITDIMNNIGKCIVSGNVRRGAQLACGNQDDEDFIDFKNYSINPDREDFGWLSNNSILVELGTDYSKYVDRICDNGEPGFLWLENAANGRLTDIKSKKDNKVLMTNPCGEIFLEDMEQCNLAETFIFNHKNIEEFKTTLKYAYLYTKTVTLGELHWPESNRVTLRNRRIGCSMSGIAQFIDEYGVNELKKWCKEGYLILKDYDSLYSDWFCIPRSIKLTTVKPNGTTSLLAGVTPGLHFAEYDYYIRRIELSNNSELLIPIEKAGYKVEPKFGNEKTTVVVEIPIKKTSDVRTVNNVSLWEQMSIAALLQNYWADNSVSITVSFDPKKEGDQIDKALNYFQYQLKSVSFLPRKKERAYKQMPYEAITEEHYNELISKIKPVKFKEIHNEIAEAEKYCDNDTCTI